MTLTRKLSFRRTPLPTALAQSSCKYRRTESGSPSHTSHEPLLHWTPLCSNRERGFGFFLGLWEHGRLSTFFPRENRYNSTNQRNTRGRWIVERADKIYIDYLLGLRFHIETDHKPLVPLFSSKKSLDELPLRVQRFRLRMMRYSFSISHVPGKSLIVVDDLSGSPPMTPTIADIDFKQEVSFHVSSILNHIPATESRLAQVRQHQEQDEVCKWLIQFCLTQWPEKHMLEERLQPYYGMAREMSIEDGLLLRGSRIVIPSALQHDTLQKIHAGHMGIAKCWEKARQGVWWPRRSKQLELAECRPRQQNLCSHPRYPSYPFKTLEQTCSNGMARNTCWSSTTTHAI